MKDAIATPLLDCFAGIWGQRVYINALVDSSQKIEIRQAANQTLLEFDYFTEEEPTPRILSRLQDSRNDVSVDIGLARKYYPDLLFALQNGDTFARASSAQIIGIVGINADDALSVLLQATRDKENLVRLEAVKAIGYILRYTVGPARPTAEEITAVLTEVMNEAQKSGNTELAAACSKTLSMIDGQ
jgi:HEAT repeat protein